MEGCWRHPLRSCIFAPFRYLFNARLCGHSIPHLLDLASYQGSEVCGRMANDTVT